MFKTVSRDTEGLVPASLLFFLGRHEHTPSVRPNSKEVAVSDSQATMLDGTLYQNTLKVKKSAF